jgi:hypothetical protein
MWSFERLFLRMGGGEQNFLQQNVALKENAGFRMEMSDLGRALLHLKRSEILG